MKIELTCPHCDRAGTITALPDFHPEMIFCGACRKVFDYVPTIWEHLDDLNDESGGTGMFYMVPASAYTTLVDPKSQEMPALEWLISLPLEYVVYSYKNRHRRGMPSEYGRNHNPPYDNIRLTYGPRSEEFPSAVVKGYLDGQAHVGEKGPEKKNKDQSSPTIRQGRMSYSQLRQIAVRQGKVEWAKSKVKEILSLKDGQILAYSNLTDKKGHVIRRHEGAYFCKEIV